MYKLTVLYEQNRKLHTQTVTTDTFQEAQILKNMILNCKNVLHVNLSKMWLGAGGPTKSQKLLKLWPFQLTTGLKIIKMT